MIEQYDPLEFELIEERGWATFARPMNYVLRNRFRFFKVFQYILKYFHLSNTTFVDLGPYPGTFLRLLRQLGNSDSLALYGVGLNASDRFVSLMQKECKAAILEVNLDPTNPSLMGRDFPGKIPLADNTASYIHAGEIIEHFTNPEHMLREAYRILRPGGSIIMTTPNVTRIGNLLRLFLGRSPLERLGLIGLQDPHDEWQPHFHEYCLKELTNMLRKHGFRVVYRSHYNCNVTEMVVRDWKQKSIAFFKIPFYVIPYLKEDLFLVACKT
jgi:SAM-dependent methyltransferase